MNVKEKRKILKHIRLGTKEVLYYPYTEGKQVLPLRPISTWEMDDCFYRALDDTPENIANFIVKVKLDLIDRKTNINVENTGYVKLMRFYNTIDYWVVYYGMKDFQDESFSTPNYSEDGLPNGFLVVKKMDEIHEIAKFILTASSSTEEIVKEVFRNEFGKELGYMLLVLKQPLADVTEITRLQRDFVLYTKGELPKIIKGEAKKDKYVISGKKMTLKEVFERFQ
jgi:hypothetical protein